MADDFYSPFAQDFLAVIDVPNRSLHRLPARWDESTAVWTPDGESLLAIDGDLFWLAGKRFERVYPLAQAVEEVFVPPIWE